MTENQAAPRQRRGISRWVIGLILLWGLVAAGSALSLYFIPKSTGDSFASNLLDLNIGALEDALCDDTSLRDLRREIARPGGLIAGLLDDGSPLAVRAARRALTDAMHVQSRYNPLTGSYTFQYVLDETISVAGFRADAGFATPEIKLRIQNQFIQACIEGV